MIMKRITFAFIYSLLFSSQVYAWTINADFEKGSPGMMAVGSDGFTGTAGRSYYSNQKVHSGNQSAQLNIEKGATGFGIWDLGRCIFLPVQII